MDILNVIFDGYNIEQNQYAKCFLLIRQELYSTAYCYEQSVYFGFPVCSDLEVHKITEDFCAAKSEELLDSFYIAKDTGCAFICFIDPLQSKLNFFDAPRFSESDFEKLITTMGGRKILETNSKTPDFYIEGIIMELKDLQKEGLFDKDRRKAIAGIFDSLDVTTVNLDLRSDYGYLGVKYQLQIRNTIQNHIKKASEQIKAYKQANRLISAGVILLNTGMFSLPDDMFRKMITHILTHNTNTIEFAFVFSQVTQSNGFDTVANFYCDFIGNVPERLKELKNKAWDMVENKMTELIVSSDRSAQLIPIHPVSFYAGGKIFYWNPGQLPDSRRVKQ